eukprot:3959309-Prymnesium_polylepis.1
MGAAVAIRGGRAPIKMWYKAMCNALICKITNPQRLNTEKAISGFERATGPDRSGLCGFNAHGG